MELGFGVGSGSGAQELCHIVPMEAEPSYRTEDLGTGHQVESGNICWLLRHHEKHLGGAEWVSE